MSSSTGIVGGIVLAAGSSERFRARKQFAQLAGRRLVDHAVATVAAACDVVAVVLPPGVVWDGEPIDAAVTGGATRSQSVRAGLAALPTDVDIVVIHDAAHPLASHTLFEAVIGAVRAGADAAAPVLPTTEVIARVDTGRLATVIPRPNLVEVQMPHAFLASAFRAAHEDEPEVSDDASLFVGRGARVMAVPGERRNLHVTTPDELDVVAELIRPSPIGGSAP